ncbi:MAG: hypothetical protein C0622_00095 [Desulfuromonas sp.]|nr:MAG: hypothetical protein C0622_00095 [Desulfuromonas sp.]
MVRTINKIERAFQPGGRRPNEDQMVCTRELFGVFDGASSLVPELFQGQTGAWWASHLAGSEFARNDGSLEQLSSRANSSLHDAMRGAGVASADRLACWSTSMAAVRVGEETLDWAQIGDCLILAIDASGDYRLIPPYESHDTRTLLHLKQLIADGDPTPHASLRPLVEEVRCGMNRDYGVINGEQQALDFLASGSCSLADIRHLLIFTDGLLPPTEDPDAEPDFSWLVNLYLKGGLGLVHERIRTLEAADPDCHRYPRFKMHDDVAAVALSLA